MIVWLASFPKSGNTYLRSLISAYLYSNDGLFNFDLLKNTIQFPNKFIFDKLGIDFKSRTEQVKNYLKAQKFIHELGKNNTIQFVKTHSSCSSIGNHKFLSFETTLGAIHIVRDPRNVVTSYSKHFKKTKEQSVSDISNELIIGVKSKTHPPTYVGSWNFHYNSWKQLNKSNRYMLVKYEDLLKDPEKILVDVLNFIYKLGNSKISIDKKKLANSISSTNFDKMQKLEKKEGFFESKKNEKTGENIPFFNLGKKNDWRNHLDNTLIKKIENIFEKEMLELNYL